MDPRKREQREREAFDQQIEDVPLPNDTLLLVQHQVERFRHAFAVKRLPFDLLFKTVGDVSDKAVLDIGCADGFSSTLLGLFGARVTGIDVSERFLQVAVRRSEINGVRHRVTCLQASAHDLPFASASFDLVFGKQILHHVDTALASKEIHRVLRPGGRGVFLEPVAFSPILRRFRKTALVMALVKDMRVSPDEEPLTRRQIEDMGAPFSTLRICELQMFARLGRILGEGKPRIMLNDLDNLLFRHVPYFRRFAREAVIELVK